MSEWQLPGAAEDWIIVPIDLADAARLFAYGRADEYIGRAVTTRRQHRYETRPFRIVTGKRPGEQEEEEEEAEADEEGPKKSKSPAAPASTELEPYKDPRFRDALLLLMGDDVLLMELLFPIIVFRCRLDRTQCLVDEMQSRRSGLGFSSTMLLPIQFQPLDERTGILAYVENRRTGQRFYRYRPVDERLLKDWQYIVYEVPRRTPGQFVPEVANASTIVSTMTPPPPPQPLRGRGVPRPRYRITGAGLGLRPTVTDDNEDAAEDGGIARLPSQFRALSWHAADVNLARMTRKFVEAQTAGPQRVLITRPVQEVRSRSSHFPVFNFMRMSGLA